MREQRIHRAPTFRNRAKITGALPFILCAATLIATLAASPAWAVSEHAFDPTLSLRGNCAATPLDQVPDPGSCPGIPAVDHPLQSFDQPCGTAVDSHGDIYVSSAALGSNGTGLEGRVDIFNPKGEYLTEISDPNQPCSIAVDSEGNIYLGEYAGKSVVRFDSKSYPPTKGAQYEPRSVVFQGGESFCESAWSVAVDPSNDHLFIAENCKISEYDAAANGNAILKESIGEDLPGDNRDLGVNGVNHDLYVAGSPEGGPGVFVLDGADYTHVKCTVKGLASELASIAVDQANGDFYVDNVTATTPKAVLQFDSSCNEIASGKLERSFEKVGVPIHSVGLAVDDPLPGQTDYDSENEGYVYVSQGNVATSHLYAFKPKIVSPPEIKDQTAAAITETEALLRAELNAGGKPTSFHFEYIADADYEANGERFGAGAVVVPVPDANAGEESSFISVSEPITGLKPGTTYRFRLVASNCEALGEEKCLTEGEGIPGGEGTSGTFATYAVESVLTNGRAYELVTPPDTNGRVPTMAELGGNNVNGFDTTLTSPRGESLVFGVRGGSLPDLGGGGFNDTYVAVRGQTGWQSSFTGLDGTQAEAPYVGGISPDHSYSYWKVEHERGSLPEGNYLRSPEGTFEPIGIGSLGVDLFASGKWITGGGGHVIFATEPGSGGHLPVRLEPQAPPGGVGAIYDRTPDGATKVLSGPPVGASPATTVVFEQHDAKFQGVSTDGTAVAFDLNGVLYLHRDGLEGTREVASGALQFGGISQHGERILYLRPNSTEPVRANPSEPKTPGVPQGEIFSFDATSGVTSPVGSGDESVLVNSSFDGSSVYFVSPEVLATGAELGEENLYAWNSASSGLLSLVAIVAERDVAGEPAKGASSQMTDGLGLWLKYAQNPIRSEYQGLGADPSRTSPGSSAFLFESRAELTEFENGGHSEIYRYDPEAEPGQRLICVSCNPTGVQAESDALLQTPPAGQFSSFPPTNDLGRIENMTNDGKTVFFQSADRLASGDIDGKIDVYQWEAQGVGGCERETGCLHLISSGRSATNDYLYAMTPDGSDVFFETGDTLVAQDPDNTPSVYDARAPHVPGEPVGFPPPSTPPAECLGEACQPAAVVPIDPTPASSNFEGAGNQKAPGKRCPKGNTRRHGKANCAKGAKHKHAKHKKKRVKRRAS